MNKMATVVGVFESGTPQIQFDGESYPAQKEYPFLSYYKAQVNDRVICLEFGDSYIILGAPVGDDNQSNVKRIDEVEKKIEEIIGDVDAVNTSFKGYLSKTEAEEDYVRKDKLAEEIIRLKLDKIL